MQTQEIVKLEQLPIITEKLDNVSKEIKIRVDKALELECDEDTVKEIKKIRAEFNKEFDALETQRKEVKNAIMEKYNAFEDIYKEKISEVYKNADEELKSKIAEVEDTLKEEKKAELQAFVEEHCIANHIHVDFDRIGLNITLSASMKSLKEQAKVFIEKVASDLKLIELEENYKDEILLEYNESLDYVDAKTKVVEKHKKLEEIEKQRQEREQLQKQDEKTKEKIEEIVAPKEIIENEDIIEVKFTVRGKIEQIKKIKDLIIELGVEYE